MLRCCAPPTALGTGKRSGSVHPQPPVAKRFNLAVQLNPAALLKSANSVMAAADKGHRR